MLVRVLNNDEACPKSDLSILPFGIVSEIDFKKQLDGNAEDLLRLGRISKRSGGALLVGCLSDNYGLKRRSVFVFESGKLTAICDMNTEEGGFALSRGYKTFSCLGEKIGVLVDKDIYSPASVFALTACGCTAIIDLYADFLPRKAKIAAELYAYCYGVNFVLVSKKESCVFNSYGEEVNLNGGSSFLLPRLKKCSEARVKKRGIFF